MADKAALMEGNTAEARAPGEGLSAAQLIEEAKKTQEQDSAALDRMARMVHPGPAPPHGRVKTGRAQLGMIHGLVMTPSQWVVGEDGRESRRARTHACAYTHAFARARTHTHMLCMLCMRIACAS
jgi:sarcosine oxidase gamma subunit